jgi:hypothetical protein
MVRTEASQTVIEALDPQTMVAAAGELALQPVADEASTRLLATLDTLGRSGPNGAAGARARRHRHAARGPKTPVALRNRLPVACVLIRQSSGLPTDHMGMAKVSRRTRNARPCLRHVRAVSAQDGGA